MADSELDPTYRTLVPPWDAGPSRTLLETPIFRVTTHTARSRLRDHQAPFLVIDTADWVNVIARTPGGRVVLVEQYRHGTSTVTVELPGGMLDADEDAISAGLRELVEETGFRPGPGSRVLQIGVVAPNPAIQSNRCTTVLVDGVLPGDSSPDPDEELAVRLVPQDQLGTLVRHGIITHSLVVAAFHHLHLFEG